MTRAFNLFMRYSPDQLKARRAKITGNPRNRVQGVPFVVFKRSPTRQLADIDLALMYCTLGAERRKARSWWRHFMVLVGLTIGLQLFWSTR
jgi:hypothetical protein